MTVLEKNLLEAHARSDLVALSRLYTRAAESEKDPDARAFFLTQAWVYALDAGMDEASHLHATLAAWGRV